MPDEQTSNAASLTESEVTALRAILEANGKGGGGGKPGGEAGQQAEPGLLEKLKAALGIEPAKEPEAGEADGGLLEKLKAAESAEAAWALIEGAREPAKDAPDPNALSAEEITAFRGLMGQLTEMGAKPASQETETQQQSAAAVAEAQRVVEQSGETQGAAAARPGGGGAGGGTPNPDLDFIV